MDKGKRKRGERKTTDLRAGKTRDIRGGVMSRSNQAETQSSVVQKQAGDTPRWVGVGAEASGTIG